MRLIVTDIKVSERYHLKLDGERSDVRRNHQSNIDGNTTVEVFNIKVKSKEKVWDENI